MIRLHGFAASNYFNMAKLALLEKGVEFEVVNVHGSQDPDFLAKSPRGKVPVLETAQGFLNETNVILEYIEETQGGKSLLPSDPYERGVVRALTKEIELYIELPARSCFMEVFFGGKVDQAIKDKARVELLAGVDRAAVDVEGVGDRLTRGVAEAQRALSLTRELRAYLAELTRRRETVEVSRG